MIVYRNMVIDGCDLRFVSNVFVRGANGADLEQVGCISISPDGELRQAAPAATIKVTDQMTKILIDSVALIDGITYTLAGGVYPVGTTVYLSDIAPGTEYETLVERLENSVIASEISDADGAFSFGTFSNGGSFTVWAKVPILSADDINAAVALEATTEDDEVMMNVQCIKIEVSAENITGLGPDETANTDPERGGVLSIAGVVPSGVSHVYLSEGESTEYGDLINTIRAQADVAADLTYSIPKTDIKWTTHQAWIIRDSALNFSAKIVYLNGKICLAGETPITMADGSTRRLDALEVGDMVLSGAGEAVAVTRVEHGDMNEFHTLYTFEDGTVIDEIHAHRFYNVDQGFYQELGQWSIGERALRQDGAAVALVSVERVDEPKQMFGLWTQSHDYFANGLLSGETQANQRLIADATAEQAANMAASLAEYSAMGLLGQKGLMP